jgi:hypothetical protein
VHAIVIDSSMDRLSLVEDEYGHVAFGAAEGHDDEWRLSDDTAQDGSCVQVGGGKVENKLPICSLAWVG